jgi:nitrogen fixation/metabolism regulation signal transduction histidine kinase
VRITIGVRLGFGFFVMLFLVAATGTASVIAFVRLADQTAVIAQESEEIRCITDIRVRVSEADSALARAMIAGMEEDIAIARSMQEELYMEVTAYLNSKEVGSNDSELLDRLQIASQQFDTTFESYLNLAGIDPEAFSRRQVFAVDPYLTVLTEIESEVSSRMVSDLDEIHRAQTSLQMIMIGFTVIAALIGIGLAVRITRSVTVPVGKLVEAADQISVGDLDAVMEVHSQDEIGELAESLERMRVSMKAAIERLRKRI